MKVNLRGHNFNTKDILHISKVVINNIEKYEFTIYFKYDNYNNKSLKFMDDEKKIKTTYDKLIKAWRNSDKHIDIV